MKNFLMREISESVIVHDSDGDEIEIKAVRTRTSGGTAMISVRYGNQSIVFDHPDDYEQHTRELLKVLESVVDDFCELPGTPSQS